MKNQKRTLNLVSICIALAMLTVTAAAVIITRPESESGSFEHKIINRVDFKIENTDFLFTRNGDEQIYNLTIFVTAKKTEADFYALINNISIIGIEYESCVVTPSSNSALTPQLPNAVLAVDENGDAAECLWEVNLTFKEGGNGNFFAKPILRIAYTSGVKQGVEQKFILDTDLSIQINAV